jgi:hypothetical protein
MCECNIGSKLINRNNILYLLIWIEVVSSELIKVMVGEGKEGGRAISMPWRY